MKNDNFEILSVQYESKNTIIYKARRKRDELPVIIKMCKDQDDSRKLKYEYDILKHKKISGICNVIDLIYDEEQVLLVTEDKNGVVLDSFIKEGPISEKDFVVIAKNAAAALAAVHESKIVHKDIKPSNMLINPTTFEVWFIDFGISTNFNEQNSTKNDGLQGTLEFVSPEQTGRIDLPIDGRSDLYSLGVTFYLMVTGRLPFEGSTTMELIHAHIAMQPDSPSETENVNEVISGIILKLLKKSPAERYQSARSLESDMRTCCEMLAAGGGLEMFALGQRDPFLELRIDEKVFAKDKELNQLKTIFDRTIGSRGEMVILKGLPSTGKTLLMNEFENYVIDSSGLYFSGEYENGARSEPYYALREAFVHYNDYANNLDVELKGFREALLKGIGNNGQALISLFPFMENLLGQQPPLIPLSFSENQNRTEQVFKVFVQTLTSTTRPNVVFMDNVHYADYNSLKLFVSALSDKETKNCVVVLALRSDAYENNEGLEKILEELEDVRFKVTHVQLAYLSLQETHSAIAEILNESMAKTSELSDYVYEMSGGRPFEVTNTLKTLCKKKLLTFDTEREIFEWDIEKIKNTKLYVDMASAYLATVKGLDRETQNFASFLATCGNDFKVEYISVCSGGEMSEQDVTEMMNALIAQGIVEYRTNQSGYSFIDRIMRATCYDLLSEKKKQITHYTIGKNLLEKYYADKKMLDYYCSPITDHLNFAGDVSTSEEEANMLAELNLKSGNRAYEAGDSIQAIRYYENGINILGDSGFKNNYKVAFELYLNLGECCFSNGNYFIAHEVNKILLENIDNEKDRYLVYSKNMRQYNIISDYEKTIEIGTEYLKDSGLLLDENSENIDAIIDEQEQFVRDNIRGREYKDVFFKLPYAGNELLLQTGSILSIVTVAFYRSGHQYKDYYTNRALRFVHENGITDDFGGVMEIAALKVIGRGDFKGAEKVIKSAFEYAELQYAPKSMTYLYYGMLISHWLHPVSESMLLYKEAKNCALAEGKLEIASYDDLIMLDIYAYTGTNLGTYLREVEMALGYAKKTHHRLCVEIFSGVHKQYAKCLLGKTVSPDSFNDKLFDEDKFLAQNADEGLVLAYYSSYRLYALCLHGYYAKAVETAEKLAKVEGRLGTSILIANNNFMYSFALLQLCGERVEQKDEYLKIVGSNQERLFQWSENCNENFMTRYLFIDAEIMRVGGENIKILPLYSEALSMSNEKSESNYINAMVQECIAKFWTGIQLTQYILYHKAKAYSIYKSMDLHVKSMQLAPDSELFNAETSDLILYNSRTVSSTTSMQTTMSMNNKVLDSDMILNIMNVLSRDMNVSVISDKFLHILIQNSGTNRGFMVLNAGEKVVLEALYYSQAEEGNISTSMLPMRLDEVNEFDMPISILKYVLAKRVPIVVNSSIERYMFFNDHYIDVRNPESFICIPVIAKEKPIGAVYLENDKLSGVFSEDRVWLFNAITAQSAVILQNAIYYSEINNYTKTVESRLKEHTSELNSLIAGIAHEINSPIGVCVTVISRMKEITAEVMEQFNAMKLSKSNLREYMDEMEKGLVIAIANITRAVELVQNFKKVSVDQSTEVFEDINLYTTLSNIVEYVRPVVKKSIYKIEIIGDKELVINSCSGVLTQIFTNLIMNSAIHGFEDKPKEQCKVTIKFKEEGESIQIVHSDNGKGMTEEELEKLFQPFYTTKRNRGGSGLGTHIILSLVTQTLNGSINCMSFPGKGTSFVLLIPKNKGK